MKNNLFVNKVHMNIKWSEECLLIQKFKITPKSPLHVHILVQFSTMFGISTFHSYVYVHEMSLRNHKACKKCHQEMKWTCHETQLPFHIILVSKYNSYLQTVEYIYNEKKDRPMYIVLSPWSYSLGNLWVCIRVLLHGVDRDSWGDMTV